MVRLKPAEMPPVAAVYSQTFAAFALVTGTDMKMWNASDGSSTRVIRDICGCEISQMVIDNLQRKLIVGNVHGEIIVYNFLNCLEMKRTKPHRAPVSAIIYGCEDKVIVSASWDRSIYVHDDESRDTCELLRSVRVAHAQDITAMAFSHHLTLIVTGDIFGNIKLWDFQFMTPEGEMHKGGSI